MKKTVLLTLLTVFTIALEANEINRSTAGKAAVNFFYERVNQFNTVDYRSIRPAEIHDLRQEGKTCLYAVNIEGGGFVLVSASDLLRPVAGYSLDGVFTGFGLPPQLEELIGLYMQQVREAEDQNNPANAEVKKMWQHLLTDDPEQLQPLRGEKAVEPMLSSQWDQDQYYNEMCPADPAGPGGHCYAGCVATALGQVVNYFRWPETGTGSYSYECPPYGTLTADFGNTTYEWDMMAVSVNRSNPAVALLLHHLGIACDMVYGPNGSGMYNHKAAYALRTFFKYDPETIYVYRDSTTMDWDSLLVSHLDRAIPMYYAGWSVPNINGHAFVCDGYQDDNYYHFNWGWSGSYDGYFYTSSLNPGGSNFNLAQEVVINAFPDTNTYSYPYYCQGDMLLEATDGTIDDGSGPVYDYLDGTECSWLIAPDDSVESITLEFIEFSTAGGDIVNVYDGPDMSSPLLGSFQGPDLPGEISGNGDKMLVTFTTDNSGAATGWLLSYTAEVAVYCSGMTGMTEQCDTFSDGSGNRDYHNGTTCMWMIDPPGASSLTLYFTSFNTEEGHDLVKIFDLQTQELLAEYSGEISPAPVTSPSGRMFVTFSSNASVTAAGWEAFYETDLVSVNENNTITNIQLFPNPAYSSVNLSWTSYGSGAITVIISDMAGRPMIHNEFASDNGYNMARIGLSALAEGIYLLRISKEGDVTYRKLIVR